MNTKPTQYFKEIDSIKSFLNQGYQLSHCVVQSVDFKQLDINWKSLSIEGTCFLGCQFHDKDLAYIHSQATVFPAPTHLPYEPFRKELYTWQELAADTLEHNVDLDIYNHFSKYRHNHDLVETLYQRIHDHAIDDALHHILNESGTKKCVGMMGGHGTLRSSSDYKQVAITAQLLAQNGYYVASGGGPGIMEAANLGAYMANYTEQDLHTAIEMMIPAPHYADAEYHDLSVAVLDRYPEATDSLAIPTWFYGHEPSNVFATHIAKYFSNSIREDTLLAIALHGVVYAPGSAGTTQEIFMDAAQNHYGTFEKISPMVFLGKKRYAEDTKLYETLHQLAEGRAYQSFLHLTDSPAEVLQFIEDKPPVPYK